MRVWTNVLIRHRRWIWIKLFQWAWKCEYIHLPLWTFTNSHFWIMKKQVITTFRTKYSEGPSLPEERLWRIGRIKYSYPVPRYLVKLSWSLLWLWFTLIPYNTWHCRGGYFTSDKIDLPLPARQAKTYPGKKKKIDVKMLHDQWLDLVSIIQVGRFRCRVCVSSVS